MDVLINNAIIYDPDEKKSFLGGAAVIGSRIAEVYSEHSNVPIDRFDRVIDAKAKYLLPGFFDVHSRGDLAMVSDGARLSALAQGVLVEVIGQDGFSVAPISSKNYMLHGEYVACSLGNPQLRWKWETVFEYLDLIHGKNNTNVIFYSPHGTMRLESSLNPKLNSEGVAALKYSLEKAMDDGASGMSVSVSQSPSKDGWYDNFEMDTLLAVLKKKKGILCVDLEDSLDVRKDIDRATTLCKNNNVRLHLSGILEHDPAKYMELVSLLNKKSKDIPMLLDISPYNNRLIRLKELLPHEFRTMSPEEIRIKLKDPSGSKVILEHINVNERYMEKIRLVNTTNKEMKKHESNLLEDISKERNENIYEVLLHFLTFDIESTIFEYEAVNRSVLDYAFEHDFILPATAGCMQGRYTPDIFGAITRYISNYSGKDPSKVVEKLSSYPARFYGIKWGIKKGVKANLVLLDIDKVFSGSDFMNPRVLSEGVDYAMVNGKIIWEKGKVTGSKNGDVISWA